MAAAFDFIRGSLPGPGDPAHDDLRLLDLMLDDMERAPAEYRPTNFWSSGLPAIISDLRRRGVEAFRSHPSALRFYVPRYAPDGYGSAIRAAARLLGRVPKGRTLGAIVSEFLSGSARALADYRVFLAADSDAPPRLLGFGESDFGGPAERFRFGGIAFSRSWLNYARGLAFLKQRADCRGVRRVVELGGGYGTLGEILLKSPDGPYFYLDVDIPPVAFVATRYLQAVFGAGAVADYAATRDIPELRLEMLQERFRAAVLMPWQLPRLSGAADLFVNYISFQEMEPEVVENYARHAMRLGSPLVLLRNSRTGKQVAARPGEPGVGRKVFREDYLRFFAGYDLAGLDSLAFGEESEDGSFASEVMVLRRRA